MDVINIKNVVNKYRFNNGHKCDLTSRASAAYSHLYLQQREFGQRINELYEHVHDRMVTNNRRLSGPGNAL